MDKLYTLWMLLAGGIGNKRTYQLAEMFGSGEEAYSAAKNGLLDTSVFSERDIARFSDTSLDGAKKTLDLCDKYGLKPITVYDADYPTLLRGIKDPPLVLFVKGNLPDLEKNPSITVVGMRDCTEMGKKIAARLSYELSMRGIAVVSGLATGIDTYAHKGCMYAGVSPTVAVLAAGAEKCQPASNRDVYNAILERNGAVISEVPPETGFQGKWMYPLRNRILSGLTSATLVVESSEKGGSLITAEYAVEQGRKLYAVPGSIDAENSLGANALLRAGAVICTGVEDIVRDYEPKYKDKLIKINKEELKKKAQKEKKEKVEKREAVLDGLSGNERLVYSAIAENALCADELCEIVGLPFPAVVGVLRNLELAELITSAAGGYYTIKS